jgi:hypothetical protein
VKRTCFPVVFQYGDGMSEHRAGRRRARTLNLRINGAMSELGQAAGALLSRGESAGGLTEREVVEGKGCWRDVWVGKAGCAGCAGREGER